MRRLWGVVAAAALAACGGSRPRAKPAAEPLDIWDLAPPGTSFAIGARYGDWWDLPARAEAAIARAPSADHAREYLAGMLSYPHVDMRSRKARQAAGVDDDGLRVSFWTRGGRLWAYRVIDRAAYDRTYRVRPDRLSRGRLTIDRDGDTCAQIGGFQVCGTRELLLQVLDGKRSSIEWPAGPAPTVRVWAAPSVLGGLAGATEGGDGLRVEVDVGRGGVRARAHLSGTPGGILAAFGTAGGSPLVRRLPAADLSGAAVLNLTGWFQRTRQAMIANVGDGQVTTHVSKADLVAGLRGDAALWALRGDRGIRLAIGFDRMEVARRLIGDCEELAPALPDGRIARDGAVCRIRHAALAAVGAGEIVVRLQDDALVAEIAGSSASAAPGRRAAGSSGGGFLDRVRTGDDGLAMWGVGLFAPLVHASRATRTISPDEFAMWVCLQVTETAGAIRIDPDGIRAELAIETVASYPDPVQAAVAPLLARVARGEDIGATAFRDLAAAQAGTPYASDLSEGSVGPTVPLAATVFVGAAVVELSRELAGMAQTGAALVSAYQDEIEAACRCKDVECAGRAAERLDAWMKRNGETEIDAVSLARVGELSRQAEGCLAPFFPEEEEAGDGGE